MISTQPSIFHSSSRKSALRHARKRASSLRHDIIIDDKHSDDSKPHHRSAKTSERPRRASSLSRTAPHLRDKQHSDMALESTSVASISALAATARNLFRRAKISGPDFVDVAPVVRSLHTVIKHLRAEAEDPDSLLNSTQHESSVYARQLTPIVEDTDFCLKQLDTFLEKYGTYPGDYNNNDGELVRKTSVRQIEDRERDMLQLIRTKLANQKTHIDIFLDTVQLHNPARQHRPLNLENTNDKQQNSIKDTVDMVAQRLFQRRAMDRVSGEATDDSDEEMWQQFWAELVKEGFSSDVLRQHKEVLRAYIRELEENGSADDTPPSVRGLLDHAAYATHKRLPYPDAPAPAYGSRQQYAFYSPLPPPVAIPSSYQSRGDSTSPRELLPPAMDNEKFSPAVKHARRRSEQVPINIHSANRDARDRQPSPYNPATVPAQLSYDRRSFDSASSGTESNPQLALMSTQDLMDSDMLAVRVSDLQLSPPILPVPEYGVSPGTSPNGRYLPPPSTIQGLGSKPAHLNLSSSTAQVFGTSPRYVPPLSAYASCPPPPYSDVPATAPSTFPSSAPATSSTFPPLPMDPSTSPRRRSRLAPDSQGAEIPVEAKWTRIKRTLVSPEVLDRAGMRYEARPDFVAVLGVLTREQIESLARKTVEVRTGRARGNSDTSRPREKAYHREERRGKKSSRLSETTDDEDSHTSSEAIWDESDESDSDSDSQHSNHRPNPRTHKRSGSATDKYIPREVRHRQRRDSATIIQEEPEHGDADEDRKDKKRRSRTYPIIVPPMDDKGSPAATVAPKPILKNRNENHVRFHEDGPREMSVAELEREKERRERRHADERRRRERGGERSERSERGDRDRRERSERHRGDREPHHRHRDRDEAKERRRTKKNVWTETIGAVGIGGAAASLLSVLTEAASGF